MTIFLTSNPDGQGFIRVFLRIFLESFRRLACSTLEFGCRRRRHGSNSQAERTVDISAFSVKNAAMHKSSRGRPFKFGRPAQLLALTLPEDVVRWLKGIHADPAWAIVSLFESGRHGVRHRHLDVRANPELLQLPGRRALIVVDPHSYRSLPGVSVIPMGSNRAFLALEGERGIADLELAVLDRLEDSRASSGERLKLRRLRAQVRDWRRSKQLAFSRRSIILVEQKSQKPRNRAHSGQPR
jgi:hypothetical protein